MNATKKQLLIIYSLSALFSGGRLFVGAISVLYILSHGISIAQFSLIKSVQVITFLILDIPMGFWVQKIGSRNSIIFTFAFSILGLFIYIVGSNFNSFLVAEIFLAISLCLCPAAFSDYLMRFLNEHPELIMEKVFHRNEMYTNIANVFCGALGGYFYAYSIGMPYAAGIIIQTIGLCVAYKMTSSSFTEAKNVRSTLRTFKSSLKNLRKMNITIAVSIFLLFIIQFTIQPLYHYWQPLFHEINPQVSGKMLGSLFMSYSICAIILNYLFSKLVNFQFFRSLECVFMLLLISSGFYFITSLVKTEFLAFISFTLLQGVFFTALTCISANINKSIDNENRPVILKTISFLSRIGMLLSFSYIQIFAISNQQANGEIHRLYLQSSIILTISIVLVTFIYQYINVKGKQKDTYEPSR